MIGVRFGTRHTYDDFGLLLVSKEIGSPAVKTKEIAVEGASITLDYTEAFGEVKYGRRPLNFEFKTNVPQAQFMSKFSAVQNALHGKKVQIVLDDDTDYFYLGRLTVSEFTNDKNIGIISISCDCEPWKFKADATIIQQAVSGTVTLILTNGRKRSVPEITTDASMSIEFGSNTYNIGAGTSIIPTLELVEGNNTLNITGTGNITFSYWEGGL